MRRASLSASFIVRVLAVLVAVQALMLVLTYRMETTAMQRQLRAKVDAVGRLIAHASLRVMEENDITDAGLLIDEALKDSDFAYVKLEDPSKFVAIDRKGPVAADQVASYKVTKGAELLGTLYVGYSHKGVEKELARRMLAKGGELVLLLAGLSLVVVVLFRSRVARRVSVMADALEQATHGDLTVNIADRNNDELTRIAEGINFLTEQLRLSFVRIGELSDATARTADTLVASFTEGIAAMAMQHQSTEEISAAIANAAQGHGRITRNTQQLRIFSEQNTVALQQSVAISREIAGRILQLSSGMHDAQRAVDAISRASRHAVTLADQATSVSRSGATSAGDVRSSVTMIAEVISESAAQTDKTARVVAEKGMKAVSQTRGSMEGIHALTESLTESMLKLDTSSKDIARIVAVIDDVAKRTKLLSLNTSIIAAQAGEHGRSFMVVASEMKQLSDLTANHTMEIAGILGTVQQGIAESVARTQDASRRVEEGITVVAHAGESLEEILVASRDSAVMARKVMEAATLQQQGLKDVLVALDQLERLNTDVSSALVAEQGNIDSFAQTISLLCESMEAASSSTQEQGVTMQQVLGSLVTANDQISQITVEIEANQHENQVIAESVQTVTAASAATVDTLNGASDRLTEAFSGIHRLRQEMERFKT
jgi:methyl-accepting chemotaxis protein